MTSPGRQSVPGVEERTSPEEHAPPSSSEQEGNMQNVGSLNSDAKQQLFIKRLYALSQKHLEETPVDRLVDQSLLDPRSCSPVSESAQNAPTATSSQPSKMVSFVNRLSEMASVSRLSEMTSCVGIDALCTGKFTHAESPPREAIKKTSIMLPIVRKPEIPATITLSSSRVSLLDDDDSLARHFHELEVCTPERHKKEVPHPIGMDDLSKQSPQGVADMTYDELHITRIPPLKEIPSNDDDGTALESYGQMEI